MDNKETERYYYELKYVNDNEVITHKFPALIDIEQLQGYIYRFLLASGWQPSTLREGGFYEP